MTDHDSRIIHFTPIDSSPHRSPYCRYLHRLKASHDIYEPEPELESGPEMCRGHTHLSHPDPDSMSTQTPYAMLCYAMQDRIMSDRMRPRLTNPVHLKPNTVS